MNSHPETKLANWLNDHDDLILKQFSTRRKREVPVVKDSELVEDYPVANTFIQFSAPRSTSLEKFLTKRQTQSCPGSRMVSVDEEEPVEHWPATRGPSLEEESNERPQVPSRVPSRMASVDEELPEPWPATRGPSLEEEARCQTSRMLPLDSKECIQFPAPQLASNMVMNVDELAWDPSQWNLEPTSSIVQGENDVFMNAGGMTMETEFVVEPISRLNPWQVNWEPFLQPVPVPDSQGEFVFSLEQMPAPGNSTGPTAQAGQSADSVCPTSQNLAKWDAMNEKLGERDPLLEKFLMKKSVCGKRSSTLSCDASDSTTASSLDGDAVRELLLPKGMFDDTPHNSERDSSPSRMEPEFLSAQCYTSSMQPCMVNDEASLTRPQCPDPLEVLRGMPGDNPEKDTAAILAPSHMQPFMVDDQACWTCVPDDNVDRDLSATLAINLTYSLGMWSIGSAKHATGDCKPCGFLWKKGCQKAQNCEFCHLCPADEVKKRKRDKIAARQREQEQAMWECGDDEQHESMEARPQGEPRAIEARSQGEPRVILPRVIPPLPK